MGNELAVIGGDSQPQVGLLTERLDLVGQELLSVVIVQLVAVLQQLQGQHLELAARQRSGETKFLF